MRCLLKNFFAKLFQVCSLKNNIDVEQMFRLENIQSQGIRFRLYTNERFKRERLLAEASVMFGAVNLDEDMCKIIPLERPHVCKTLFSD